VGLVTVRPLRLRAAGAAAATSIEAARGARAGRFFGGAVVVDLIVRIAAFLRELGPFLAAFFGAFGAPFLTLFWPSAAASAAAASLRLISSSFF
jgi:hypothetical protein